MNLCPWTNLPVCTLNVNVLQIIKHIKRFSLTALEQFNLAELGVLSWRLDADKYETDEELKKIRAARGYSYVVCYLAYVFL